MTRATRVRDRASTAGRGAGAPDPTYPSSDGAPHDQTSRYAHDQFLELFPMYDMYPEWGPSRNRDDNDDALTSVQVGLDLRDNGGQRPDDN